MNIFFCGRWYRPDYIDAHRSSMDLQTPIDLQNPSLTLPTEGGEATQRTKKSGKYYLPVKEERGKREQGEGKLPQICDRNEK